MIEKIESQSNVSRMEAGVVSQAPVSMPDLPQMIEEENVREALSMAQDVLRGLSETILQNDQANSPDADRSQGRISADVIDLISG